MADDKNDNSYGKELLEPQERYINPYTDFGFKKLFEQAEIAQYTPAERREYEASVKNYWDYYSTMKSALNRGRAEGRADEKIDNARSLKENGVPVAIIAKSLGLTEDEVERL